jgi:hypothetical protein
MTKPPATSSTPTNATATLLGLPRELRNIIYSPLTWTGNVCVPDTLYAPVEHVAKVAITSLPFLTIQLVNAQNNTEYDEATFSGGLTGIFDAAGLVLSSPDAIKTDTNAAEWLARMRHATIFVDDVLDDYNNTDTLERSL